MKAAAAVLAASLLFFLGVLTGTGRRESVPPPAAIRLGVLDQSASDRAGSQPPSDGPGATTTTGTPSSTDGPAPSPTGPSTPATPSRPSTPPSTASTAPPAPTAPPARPSTTAATGRPGGVEKVDREVACSRGNGKGKGGPEPCPPTTTGRDEGRPGGGNNR